MYFYSIKFNNHESEQAQLLEMYSNACLCNGNGKAADGIIIIKLLY